MGRADYARVPRLRVASHRGTPWHRTAPARERRARSRLDPRSSGPRRLARKSVVEWVALMAVTVPATATADAVSRTDLLAAHARRAARLRRERWPGARARSGRTTRVAAHQLRAIPHAA